MEENKHMEQAGAASAVPTEKKSENRKREVSGKKQNRFSVIIY